MRLGNDTAFSSGDSVNGPHDPARVGAAQIQGDGQAVVDIEQSDNVPRRQLDIAGQIDGAVAQDRSQFEQEGYVDVEQREQTAYQIIRCRRCPADNERGVGSIDRHADRRGGGIVDRGEYLPVSGTVKFPVAASELGSP